MLVIKSLSFPGLKNLHRMIMRSRRIKRMTRLPRKKNKLEKRCISRFDITVSTKDKKLII